MKKTILLIVLFFAGVTGFVSAQEECNQTFYGTLRYYKGYIFNDTFNNPGPGSLYLWNYQVDSKEQYDYNNSPDFPQFDRTNEIISRDYEVKGSESIKFINALTPYYIYYVPAKRESNNLMIKYTVTYSTDVAGKIKKNHTECKYYEISRCGDGVKDSSYDEECDKTDGTPQGYTCSSTCKLVQTPIPTCTLTLDKASMLSGDSATLSWNISGISDFPTSIISNPILSGFPHPVSTSIGNKTVTINQVGTFGFNMIVKNINGQNSCNANITVTPPAPTCTLTINKSSMLSGDSATLSWNISGISDFPTSIISNPILSGFPHSVSTSIGSKTVTINQVGTFGFNMTVKNMNGQNSCNVIINITEEEVPPIPSPTDPDPKQ